jgi:predicted enzyme related to lactoylglutathione lyase
VTPHWATYVAVKDADADAAARQAVRLGATLLGGPRDVPGVRRFCGIALPQGVTFHVLEHVR